MNIGFLGFGNMGTALARGLIKSEAVIPKEIYALAKNKSRLEKKCKQLGIDFCNSLDDLIQKSDWIIIAVKPYQIEEILSSVKDKLKNKIIISVAAGMLFEQYEKILGNNIQHISLLPNTPVAISNGIIIAEEKYNLSEENFYKIKKIFSSISLFEIVPTQQFSIAGTLAGCTPAYIAMFIEALGDAGVMNGLSRDLAYRLAAKTLQGTAELFLMEEQHPGAMKDAVCSPAGTTIKGLAQLEENGFRSAIIKAISVAK